MSETRHMLDLAGRAAWRALGMVEPNPMVGCVLARDGEVLAIGHHRVFGGLHAEREALASCAARGIDPRGATAYVTLEPCNARGKQPACVDALIEAGIVRVVYAVEDPNPPKSGGAARLRAAGIAAEHSPESVLAARASGAFRTRISSGLPLVIAKWAQTLDGKIATRTGQSQWISGEAARRRVHRLRAKVDAIIAGIGTVEADDPMLTARGVRKVRRVARRVVLDRELRIRPDAALVRSAREAPVSVVAAPETLESEQGAARGKVLRAAGVDVMTCAATDRGLDLTGVLKDLVKRHDVSTVLVEAGPRVLGSLVESDLIDLAIVYIAPLILGDEHARSVAEGRIVEELTEGHRFELLRTRRVGPDIEAILARDLGRPRSPQSQRRVSVH